MLLFRILRDSLTPLPLPSRSLSPTTIYHIFTDSSNILSIACVILIWRMFHHSWGFFEMLGRLSVILGISIKRVKGGCCPTVFHPFSFHPTFYHVSSVFVLLVLHCCILFIFWGRMMEMTPGACHVSLTFLTFQSHFPLILYTFFTSFIGTLLKIVNCISISFHFN